MSDLSQLVTDPALCAQLQTFQPAMFAGLFTAPFIEQIVQYFKEQFGLSSKLAPLTAVLFGVLGNVALATFLGVPVEQAVLMGIATGGTASGVHIVKG